MRTELLFESCPFLTSANVTLSRLGFADGDALWEIMQDEELYRYEYEAPAKERVQAEYKIQDANAQFAAKRTVTLGVYANTDLAHLIGWIEIGGADEGMNMVQLRFLFGRRCVGTEYPAEAMGALCRYLFEMARVNRVQSVCLDADIDKQRPPVSRSYNPTPCRPRIPGLSSDCAPRPARCCLPSAYLCCPCTHSP